MKERQNWNLYTIFKIKNNFIKVFPLLFMVANMQSVRKKKLDNIVLDNFRSTDTTNVTEIKQLSC